MAKASLKLEGRANGEGVPAPPPAWKWEMTEGEGAVVPTFKGDQPACSVGCTLPCQPSSLRSWLSTAVPAGEGACIFCQAGGGEERLYRTVSESSC